MADIEDNISIFPFIGSILIFLALLTPAATYSVSFRGVFYVFEYVWIWGLKSKYYQNYLQSIYFEMHPLIIYPSIICSILIFIISVIILITVFKVWRHKKNIEDIETYWLISAILLIFITIFWIIIIEIGHYYYHLSFWSVLNPGFGIIGLFIGASFILIGYILKKLILKKKYEVAKSS